MTETLQTVTDDELRGLARHYLRLRGRDLRVEVERASSSVRLIFSVSHHGRAVGGGEIHGWASNGADWWRREIAAVAR